MRYGEFEDALLGGMVEEADRGSRGQAELKTVAAKIEPQLPEQWVYDAVHNFKRQGYVSNVSIAMGNGPIVVTVTGAGRRAAERIAARI